MMLHVHMTCIAPVHSISFIHAMRSATALSCTTFKYLRSIYVKGGSHHIEFRCQILLYLGIFYIHCELCTLGFNRQLEIAACQVDDSKGMLVQHLVNPKKETLLHSSSLHLTCGISAVDDKDLAVSSHQGNG